MMAYLSMRFEPPHTSPALALMLAWGPSERGMETSKLSPSDFHRSTLFPSMTHARQTFSTWEGGVARRTIDAPPAVN